MISLLKKKRIEPTFVLAIMGDYARVESALAGTIERLEDIARTNACRVVAALEDRRWETAPLIQTLAMRFPTGRLAVVRGEYENLPAKLLTAAVEQAEGDLLHFVWPGCLPDYDAVSDACAAVESEELDWLGFAGDLAERLPELCSPDLGDRFYSYYLACGRMLPLCQAVVRRSSVLEIHGFDATPLLQREFDADFWLRSVRGGQRGLIRRGTLADCRWTWEDFPLQADFRVPRYLAQSYRARTAGQDGRADRGELNRRFAADLPATLRRTVERLEAASHVSRAFRSVHRDADETGIGPCENTAKNSDGLGGPFYESRDDESSGYVSSDDVRSAYRIAVTGGPWDFAHNQLCFFNHFRELEGRGLFSYVPLLDHLIDPERDLQDIDLVIISRGRHANVRKVLDYCRRESIATMYMIDDNWFSVGSDWPDPYASIFAAGLPQYEMFLCCLRECDAVLLYNDVLAEDVRPYARRIIRLPTNVRQADFAAPLRHPELADHIEALNDWRARTGGVIAGYIGSQRFSEGAFQALASPDIQRRRPVKIVLFGVISEQQRQIFGSQAAVIPYVGYDHYAPAIGSLAPEILVAPLDNSRTSRSKCANKYLEYSIAGAAGIYSDVPPYSQTIVDGQTGLLVADDSVQTWTAAVARLVEDERLRKSIAASARADVLARFETGIVAPFFADALLSLVGNRDRRVGAVVQEGAAC